MKKGYLANGLFSLADRVINEYIADELRYKFPQSLELFVPQEQDFNDKQSYADAVTIAKGDTEAIKEADFIIAVIDGVEIDAGVSAEIGIASVLGKPVYALYTDIRQEGRGNQKKIDALVADGTENQFMYRNLFVVGLIKQNGGIYSNIDSLFMAIYENEIKGENE